MVAAAIMALMFLCLVFCIAEMSAALPDAGATYVFARRAMGPWGGFLSGLCDNVEYVLTPAVICFFIGSYLGSMFDTGLPDWCWWIATYGLFLVLNIRGIALSFRVTLVITLISLAILMLFCGSRLPHIDIARWALNIGADGTELAERLRPALPVRDRGRACRLAVRGVACISRSRRRHWQWRNRSIRGATCRGDSCSRS